MEYIKIRGGAQEVGRSCYHLHTDSGEYLIDCGIKQEDPVKYPDFSGLDQYQIDAVFITHAHIDHIGSLPILEASNYLKEEASIYLTPPTAALSKILLWDSLKLHKLECEEYNKNRRYDEKHVESVLKRFKPIGFGTHSVDDITVEFQSSGHLLGSSWINFILNDQNVIFSGDLGGRSPHLKEIEKPPRSNYLFIESTYGDTLQHHSMSDTRNELFELIIKSVTDGKPVLIPTFAVGRSQEILQILREREHEIPGETEIVYDGMIKDSMKVYNSFATHEYMSEKLLNYKLNSGDTEPFLPEKAYIPKNNQERDKIFDGSNSNIVVAPSGMLEGGWSPYYLIRLVERYDEANIILTGYQAEGTTGRVITDSIEDGKEYANVKVTALMNPKYSDDPSHEKYGFHQKSIKVPTDWVENINGLSAHADANGLLEFARQTKSQEIYLIHGDKSSMKELNNHFTTNIDSLIEITEIGQKIDIESNQKENEIEALKRRIRSLEERVRRLEN